MSKLIKALEQRARRCAAVRTPEEAAALAERIGALAGPCSQSRQALLRIGAAFLAARLPEVFAPVCPDYAHEEGRYTFRGLGCGIPLLAQCHITFLARVGSAVPLGRVQFLIADQEAEDERLCAAAGLTPEEFRARVERSLGVLREAVAPYGWDAEAFTAAIPSLVSAEREEARCIEADASLRDRVAGDTWKRIAMYRQINEHMLEDEMYARTRRTAAQYRVLGRYAAGRASLVVNHTTTSLAWYADVEAPLLHNPVSVY